MGNRLKSGPQKNAKDLGIEIVYQEVDIALIPYLTVAENVMFNVIVNNMGKKQLINWSEVKRTAKKTLEKLNVKLDVNQIVSELTLAQKQMVLIARCVVERCRLLILDEPTAPLSNSETEELFRIVRELAKEGVAIVFISHRLNELFEICETITVMRDGKIVKNMPITPELQTKDIVELMLGRKFDDNYTKKEIQIGEPLLEIEGLTEAEGKVRDINMTVRRGEIVAVAGLVGAGKTELCKTLFAAFKQSSGTIKLNGKTIKYKNPNEAVKNGFALVPEERRKEGVLITDPVYSNISVAAMNKYTGFMSVVNRMKEKKDACKMITDLGIKTPSEIQEVALLSGGNQQKVVLGKWLNSESEIYIFDEPTKGIDVGAKRDMYDLIEKLVEQGKGVIYASCEFQEILTIADRVYVMYDGQITKELNIADTNEKELLYLSTGGN